MAEVTKEEIKKRRKLIEESEVFKSAKNIVYKEYFIKCLDILFKHLEVFTCKTQWDNTEAKRDVDRLLAGFYEVARDSRIIAEIIYRTYDLLDGALYQETNFLRLGYEYDKWPDEIVNKVMPAVWETKSNRINNQFARYLETVKKPSEVFSQFEYWGKKTGRDNVFLFDSDELSTSLGQWSQKNTDNQKEFAEGYLRHFEKYYNDDKLRKRFLNLKRIIRLSNEIKSDKERISFFTDAFQKYNKAFDLDVKTDFDKLNYISEEDLQILVGNIGREERNSILKLLATKPDIRLTRSTVVKLIKDFYDSGELQDNLDLLANLTVKPNIGNSVALEPGYPNFAEAFFEESERLFYKNKDNMLIENMEQKYIAACLYKSLPDIKFTFTDLQRFLPPLEFNPFFRGFNTKGKYTAEEEQEFRNAFKAMLQDCSQRKYGILDNETGDKIKSILNMDDSAFHKLLEKNPTVKKLITDIFLESREELNLTSKKDKENYGEVTSEYKISLKNFETFVKSNGLKFLNSPVSLDIYTLLDKQKELNFFKNPDFMKKLQETDIPTGFIEKLSNENQLDVFTDMNLRNFKRVSKIARAQGGDYSTEDLVDFHTFAYNLGCFSKNPALNQKANTWLEEKVTLKKDKDKATGAIFAHVDLLLIDAHSIFESWKPQGENEEFTVFLLGKNAEKKMTVFDEIKQENNSGQFLRRIYNEFQNPDRDLSDGGRFRDEKGNLKFRVAYNTTDEQGNETQRTKDVKPTVELFKEYFLVNKFSGVNEKNKKIADELGKWSGMEQFHFDRACEIMDEFVTKNIPANIVGTHLKETTNEIEEYKKQTKELAARGIIAAQEIMGQLTEIVNKEFTYDWLEKNDPKNFCLGLYCNCCANLAGVGYGIMRSNFVHPDVQNLVIKNKKGNPIAKSTLYVNRAQGYGVFNNVEVSNNITAEQKKEIFDVYKDGINAFVKEYNKRNPDRPIKKISVGMNLNDLSQQIKQGKKLSKILKGISFSQYGIHGQQYDGDWSQNEQYSVYDFRERGSLAENRYKPKEREM